MPYTPLPFTGLNFLIHLVIGAVLFASGLVLRLISRARESPPVHRIKLIATNGPPPPKTPKSVDHPTSG